MGNLIIYLLSFLCVFFLMILGRSLFRIWWTPVHIQKMMRLQGIKGPSYKFLHGNTQEINELRKIATSGPMFLSHDIFPRVQPHIYSWLKLYGMNFLYWHGTRPHLVFTEPELIKELMKGGVEIYEKIGFQKYIRKLLGDGVILSNGEKWLKMRKLSNHAFHGESLRDMLPAMVTSAETMLERWRQNLGKEIEVFQEFKVLTSEIISRTAFGSTYLEGQKVFEMLMELTKIVGRNTFKAEIPGITKVFKTHDEIEFDKINEEIKETIMKIVKKREDEVGTGDVDGYGSDFLGQLVKAYNDPDETNKISECQLIDECKNFYTAGQETTASSLSWTILLLAAHTNWQDIARKEVLELFGQRNPTADDIGRLKSVSMIINESLRLYPPVIHWIRELKKEVRLGKLTIPAKVEVYVPIPAVHHDPKIWGDDFHLFKPERFAEGLAKATNNNVAAYLPFGFGPRTCTGMNFAIAEMKIVICMILQHYRFTLSPAYVHSPAPILTVCPQYGVQIMLEAFET